MTDAALDRLSLLYALGAAIEDQDHATAIAIHAHLLEIMAPGAERVHRDTAVSSTDMLVQMTMRQSTKQTH